MTDIRFAFGKNWSDFSTNIGDAEIQSAMRGMTRLLPDGYDPAGKSFLDIGSGSGLHTVAAHRLGFRPVVATDYDQDSVATTEKMAAKFGASIKASRDDILSTALSGSWDVVYSWGVLHHTGDMRAAIRSSRALVRSGGTFIIAIYIRTPFCRVWTQIKRAYSSSPRFIQSVMETAFISALKVRGAKSDGTRGMNFRNDAIDWLGGYPYESASADKVVELVGPDFELVRSFSTRAGLGIFGTGCAEYTFIRRETASG